MVRGRILLVEDERLISFLWEDICDLHNVDVVGIAETPAQALEILESPKDISGVILDVHLKGGTSELVAERIRELGLPVIVSTGRDVESLPEAYQGFETILKPYRPEEMVVALNNMLS